VSVLFFVVSSELRNMDGSVRRALLE
jgi:hypothetical protein